MKHRIPYPILPSAIASHCSVENSSVGPVRREMRAAAGECKDAATDTMIEMQRKSYVTSGGGGS